MDKKLSLNEFCTLANRREDIKRKRKALQEWQAEQDIQAVETHRISRVSKKMYNAI